MQHDPDQLFPDDMKMSDEWISEADKELDRKQAEWVQSHNHPNPRFDRSKNAPCRRGQHLKCSNIGERSCSCFCHVESSWNALRAAGHKKIPPP